MEDEVEFIEQIYRIDNDISLLRNHIDGIGQIIFSCKLGIVPSDILTDKEISLISDFDSYSRMKIAVISEAKNIILTLLIPQFPSYTLSKIKFVPIPNAINKSLVLSEYEILIDHNNNIFNKNIKDDLEKNLVKIEDKCVESILKFQEAQCELETVQESSVTEIMPGILIFKNFNETITQDCNKLEVNPKGTFLIKFENCKINTLNTTYTNINLKIHET